MHWSILRRVDDHVAAETEELGDLFAEVSGGGGGQIHVNENNLQLVCGSHDQSYSSARSSGNAYKERRGQLQRLVVLADWAQDIPVSEN
jgi:hypothetical protein